MGFYNDAIPQSPDPILLSQGQLLSNYNAIASVFQNNHYDLTKDKLYQGMHNLMLMRPQASAPVTDATHVGFYNALDSNSIPELFFAPNNAQTPIQLTYSSLNTTPTLLEQYSFVAGPFVIYGGLIKNVTVPSQLITLTPATNLLYVGLTSANLSDPLITQIRACIPSSINTPMSTFTILTPIQASIDCYYLAIGQ